MDLKFYIVSKAYSNNVVLVFQMCFKGDHVVGRQKLEGIVQLLGSVRMIYT